MDNSQIQAYLKNRSLKIGVVGIGRIGLPTALCIANSGLETIGIDINEKLIAMVNSKNYPLKDEPEFDKIFDNVISQKKLSATTEPRSFGFSTKIRWQSYVHSSVQKECPYLTSMSKDSVRCIHI